MPTINREQLLERINQPDYVANFAPYLPAITASKLELLAAFSTLDDADRYQALWQSLIKGTPFNDVFMVARRGTPTDYSRGHYAKIIAALTSLTETNPTFELNKQNLAALQTDAKLLRYLQQEQPSLFITLSIPPSMEQSDAALEGLLQATNLCLERLM